MLHASSEKAGVDVYIPDEEDMKHVPHCPHGPMFLFERFFKDHSSRKFYACSACRDRKECSFFQWADEKISTTRQNTHVEIINSSKPQFSHEEFALRLEQVKSLTNNKDRQYCHDCNLLLLPDERGNHKEHKREMSLSVEKLGKPTEWLNPVENRKSNAQYLFASSTTQFMIEQFEKQGLKHIICIGTPRLHEVIQSRRQYDPSFKLDSLLMDIDSRFLQFFSPSQFCHYNMFSHYFFNGETSKKVLTDFIHSKGGVAMVMDPPFGGLASILAATIKKIWDIYKARSKDQTKEMATFWVFPYFLESRVTDALPSMVMMDYKVDYDNHPLFHKASKINKRNSPVRIFTNITPKKFVLATDEGYRYCKTCQRYVANENKHCPKCKSCTSKDGRTYSHCDQCQTCVKPGRTHCPECNRCEIPNHNCNGERKAVGCHICGEFGHKRKDCPQRERVQVVQRLEVAGSREPNISAKKRKSTERKSKQVKKSKRK